MSLCPWAKCVKVLQASVTLRMGSVGTELRGAARGRIAGCHSSSCQVCRTSMDRVSRDWLPVACGCVFWAAVAHEGAKWQRAGCWTPWSSVLGGLCSQCSRNDSHLASKRDCQHGQAWSGTLVCRLHYSLTATSESLALVRELPDARGHPVGARLRARCPCTTTSTAAHAVWAKVDMDNASGQCSSYNYGCNVDSSGPGGICSHSGLRLGSCLSVRFSHDGLW
jgi:hypothetical protein